MTLSLEYNIDLPLKRGAKGKPVKLIQEWLSLNGVGLTIDSSFGPATEAAVKKFQSKVKLPVTGRVDRATFDSLVAPMKRATSPLQTTSLNFSQRVVAAAKVHLKEHPLEVGGPNSGPWVRLYTNGREGAAWAWCAGFVSTMLKAAAEDQTAENSSPIKGSLSCDVLATQARKAGRFVSEKDLATGVVDRSALKSGAIFLVRNKKNANDWTHTGLVTSIFDEYLETIEGNTNDSGDREGYEVCARRRSYKNMDFIRL
ncbi:MAG: peptidoglycan-binding domain-containing protein [Candidatus Kapabacteria bacterium]|nr:peptidoglycan-binding domain-containing protein [Candidatus Kapabacteria bacterium]